MTKWKRMLCFLMSFLMIGSIFTGFSAFAADVTNERESNNYFSSANSLPIGNQIKGRSCYNDKDFFVFTLSKAGKVSFTVNAYVDRYYQNEAEIWLYNASYEEVEDGSNHLVFYEDGFGCARDSYSFMLQPGKYYLCMEVFQDSYANYTIATKFTASNQTFKEPDAYASQAHTLYFGQRVYGQLDSYFPSFDEGSSEREYDLYKFTLNSRQKITLNYTMQRDLTYKKDFTVKLVDKYLETNYDMIEIESGEEKKVQNNVSITLDKGTYYIMVSGNPQDLVMYSLLLTSAQKPVTVSKPSGLKTISRTSTAIKFSWNKISGAGYQIQMKSASSYKSVRTTSANSCTVSNLQPGTAYSFRIRAYKKSGSQYVYSSWVSFSGCTLPSSVKITKLSSTKKGVVQTTWGKASGNADGYLIYFARDSKFTKSVSKATVSGKSSVSYTKKGLSSRYTYYVKVCTYKKISGKTYYGAWSSVKSIKVR